MTKRNRPAPFQLKTSVPIYRMAAAVTITVAIYFGWLFAYGSWRYPVFAVVSLVLLSASAVGAVLTWFAKPQGFSLDDDRAREVFWCDVVYVNEPTGTMIHKDEISYFTAENITVGRYYGFALALGSFTLQISGLIMGALTVATY